MNSENILRKRLRDKSDPLNLPDEMWDTLLIIKPEYLVKRKSLLLHILKEGFLIKGQRKIFFTPELAAEFYDYRTDHPCFMLQVILLSKGNAEAFVLAKEHAVKELKNLVMAYFVTPDEMEKNVHVTQSFPKVKREINFIFPNYIHEPIIGHSEQIKSSVNKLLAASSLTTLTDIVTDPNKLLFKSWKKHLAASLIWPNMPLPDISKQYCSNLNLNAPDAAAQSEIDCLDNKKQKERSLENCSSSDFSKNCCSLNFTTSSCVTCSRFGSGTTTCCQQSLGDIIQARTAPLKIPKLNSRLYAGREDNLSEKLINTVDVSQIVQADQVLSVNQGDDQSDDYCRAKAFKEPNIAFGDFTDNTSIPFLAEKSSQSSNKKSKLSVEGLIFVAKENEQFIEDIPNPTNTVPSRRE